MKTLPDLQFDFYSRRGYGEMPSEGEPIVFRFTVKTWGMCLRCDLPLAEAERLHRELGEALITCKARWETGNAPIPDNA